MADALCDRSKLSHWSSIERSVDDLRRLDRHRQSVTSSDVKDTSKRYSVKSAMADTVIFVVWRHVHVCLLFEDIHAIGSLPTHTRRRARRQAEENSPVTFESTASRICRRMSAERSTTAGCYVSGDVDRCDEIEPWRRCSLLSSFSLWIRRVSSIDALVMLLRDLFTVAQHKPLQKSVGITPSIRTGLTRFTISTRSIFLFTRLYPQYL